MFIKRDTADKRLARKATVRAVTVLATLAAGLTAVVAASAAAPAAVTASMAGKVTIYSGKALHLKIGNYLSNPITSAGGALWFSNPGDDAIGRITTLGQAQQFKASGLGHAMGITAGPDGAVWFTNWGAAADPIGRISATGAVTFLPAKTQGQMGITTGPDGALWYVNWATFNPYGFTIGRLTTSGTSTVYSAQAQYPQYITTGSDGALWYTIGGLDGGGFGIGRITTSGNVTVYPLSSTGHQAAYITAGPDGALWFTLPFSNEIGRITTTGTVTTYTGKGVDQPWDIAEAPDGAMWFTNYNGNTIGRITIKGKITTFSASGISHPESITEGPDGAMWFTNPGNDTIGRITTSVTPQISGQTPASGTPGTQVIITGHNLQGATAIDFNGVPATILSDTATVVRTTVPAGATSGHITITTAVGTATSKNSFTVT